MINYNTLANKSIIYNDKIKENMLNLLDKTFSIPHDFNFDVVEITDEYIARPDLLAYEVYGDDRYADMICKINGISNPFEMNSGMIVILPASENINDFINIPTPQELNNDLLEENIDKPMPRVKNEKRKANEAVVGDSRFKIDLNKRVIIY